MILTQVTTWQSYSLSLLLPWSEQRFCESSCEPHQCLKAESCIAKVICNAKMLLRNTPACNYSHGPRRVENVMNAFSVIPSNFSLFIWYLVTLKTAVSSSFCTWDLLINPWNSMNHRTSIVFIQQSVSEPEKRIAFGNTFSAEIKRSRKILKERSFGALSLSEKKAFLN